MLFAENDMQILISYGSRINKGDCEHDFSTNTHDEGNLRKAAWIKGLGYPHHTRMDKGDLQIKNYSSDVLCYALCYVDFKKTYKSFRINEVGGDVISLT